MRRPADSCVVGVHALACLFSFKAEPQRGQDTLKRELQQDTLKRGLQRLACAFAVALSLAAACPGFAGDTTTEAKAKPDKAAPKAQATAVAISPERETAALDFARSNHPELASLLDGLKQSAPQQYKAALVDLDRAVERLAKVKERSADRYQYELSEWKLTSRIRLLAARLTMSDDPVIEGELRTALRDRVELRLTAQRAERDRLQTRVDKLNQTIEETTSRQEAIVEKQLADLKKVAPAKSAAKTKAKKASAAPATTSGDESGQKK